MPTAVLSAADATCDVWRWVTSGGHYRVRAPGPRDTRGAPPEPRPGSTLPGPVQPDGRVTQRLGLPQMAPADSPHPAILGVQRARMAVRHDSGSLPPSQPDNEDRSPWDYEAMIGAAETQP